MAIEFDDLLDRAIASHLCDAYEITEMAKKLNIPASRIKQHIYNMYERFDLTQGSRLTRLAVLLYRERQTSPRRNYQVDGNQIARLFVPELTADESRIVWLVAQGLTNRQLGQVIGGGRSYPSNRLSIVMTKVGMWTRTELALWLEAKMYHDPR